MDGGDEDEHDEGAHQVGLEHLVPHLGVLRRVKEKGKRKGEGEEERGRWRNKFSDKRKTQHAEMHLKHTNAPPQMHSMVQPQALERDRSRWVSRGVLGKVQS